MKTNQLAQAQSVKHTGIWRVEKCIEGLRAPLEHSADDLMVLDDTGLITAIVYEYPNIDQSETNARLIACAPELLRACEMALKALLPHFDSDDDGSEEAKASNALLNAIKQAKGE